MSKLGKTMTEELAIYTHIFREAPPTMRWLAGSAFLAGAQSAMLVVMRALVNHRASPQFMENLHKELQELEEQVGDAPQ